MSVDPQQLEESQRDRIPRGRGRAQSTLILDMIILQTVAILFRMSI